MGGGGYSSRCLTSVFVLCLVHLTISALPDDTDYVKLVNTALSPVTLGLFPLPISRATKPEENGSNRLAISELILQNDLRVVKCK